MMDTDIQIHLERGEYVRKRASLMRKLEIPKLSDAITALGPPLAQLVFDECDEALKEDFGLTPPLNGAGDELWVSPSDLLIGKVVLKPPLTQKHVQALTHQGILSIGQDIEIKYWNEMEMEKERALAEQRKKMLDDFEDELKAQLRLVELREQAACQQEMQRMTKEFEIRLMDQLDNLTARLRREFAELYKQQEIELREEFAETLRKEIEQTVLKMTREFLDELERQKDILSRSFRLGIQKSYTQKEYELRMQHAKYKESIRQLRHNLECKNLANMMYVLCMERRKCCDEKVDIEKHYETEIGMLLDTIHVKDQQIRELADEKYRLIMEVNLRETCLLEIIGQFQKFINFALRAAPTQAEFLLSVEKMMVFELTDAILTSPFKYQTPYTDVLPWCNFEIKGPEMVGLQIMDHHDCLNELNPPIPPDADFGPDDFLPAFHYGQKLYVREDFRNMISQGIRITKSNTLWSKDVEILMDTLQQSVSSAHGGEEEEGGRSVSAKTSKTKQTESNIQSKLRLAKVLPTMSKTDSHNSTSIKEDLRSSIKPNLETLDRVDFSKVGKVERAPAILATSCSIEMLLKKGLVKQTPAKGTDDPVVSDKLSLDDSEKTALQKLNKMIQVMVRQTEESDKVLKRRCSANTDDSFRQKEDEAADSKQSTGEGKQLFITPKGSLLLGTRDSIILRKTSMARKSTEFTISPNDSIEIRKDSLPELKGKTSKLVSTRNSLEMLRESKMKLRESAVKCTRKASSKVVKPVLSTSTDVKEVICEKCHDSVEVLDNLTQGRKDSIRVSRIEIYDVEGSMETNVAFNTTPMVYDTGSVSYSTNLSEVYKYGQTSEAAKKKFIPPPQDKFLFQRPELKVLGDPNAKEYLQSSDEFTMDRIKSFIALIKDNPKLIKTFTACTR